MSQTPKSTRALERDCIKILESQIANLTKMKHRLRIASDPNERLHICAQTFVMMEFLKDPQSIIDKTNEMFLAFQYKENIERVNGEGTFDEITKK